MNKVLIAWSILILGLPFASSSAMAAITVIDPDAFAAGTVLNNAYPGVTLTALGEPGVLSNSDVIAVASANASTGSHVFGPSGGLVSTAWGNGFYEWLRADFADGATWVSLDFIADDASDGNAELKAYDSGGTLRVKLGDLSA